MVESFPWLHRGVGAGNLGASSGPTWVGGRAVTWWGLAGSIGVSPSLLGRGQSGVSLDVRWQEV